MLSRLSPSCSRCLVRDLFMFLGMGQGQAQSRAAADNVHLPAVPASGRFSRGHTLSLA